MEIAILSDIHGNYVALKRCLDYLEKRKVDIYIFLGDYVSELPYPQRTLKILYELLREKECYFVRGNREDYMLDYLKKGEMTWKKGSSFGCLLNTYLCLTHKDLKFFQSLKCSNFLCIEGFPSIVYCHSGLNDNKQYYLPDSEIAKTILADMNAEMLVYGHTHIQGICKYGKQQVLNPGSVGLPFQKGPCSQFAIIKGDNAEWQVELLSLDYEFEDIIEELHKSELAYNAPIWCLMLEYAIRTGIDITGEIISRIHDFYNVREEDLFFVPEEIWKKSLLLYEDDGIKRMIKKYKDLGYLDI